MILLLLIPLCLLAYGAYACWVLGRPMECGCERCAR